MSATTPPFTTEVRDGQPVALLPVQGGRTAVLDLADAEHLAALGAELGSAYLTHIERGGPHVAIRTHDRALSPYPFLILAQFIAQPRPGRYVSHADGDRLNLRRGNLRS